MESEGDGKQAGQKASVVGDGAAVNVSAGDSAPKFSPYHLIWFGLEILSAALLIYLAFVRPAHGP